MKFVLVINLADDVAEDYEDFTVDYDLRGTPKEDRTVNESIKYIEDAEPKPLPEKRDEHCRYDNWELESIINAESRGFNKCLEEITGGTE